MNVGPVRSLACGEHFTVYAHTESSHCTPSNASLYHLKHKYKNEARANKNTFFFREVLGSYFFSPLSFPSITIYPPL